MTINIVDDHQSPSTDEISTHVLEMNQGYVQGAMLPHHDFLTGADKGR